MKADKKYCLSCDSDYYNHNNHSGTGECWNFKMAKLKKMYCIHWWVPQDKKENFSEITTNNCHTETGHYAFYNELPEHLRRK